MFATLLAVAPTVSPDVPVLSTLQAEPADAHNERNCYKLSTRVITHYEIDWVWDPHQYNYRQVRIPVYGDVTTQVCEYTQHEHEPPPTTTTTQPSGEWREVEETVQRWVCTAAAGAGGGLAAAGAARGGAKNPGALGAAGAAGAAVTQKACGWVAELVKKRKWFPTMCCVITW